MCHEANEPGYYDAVIGAAIVAVHDSSDAV